MKGRLAIPIHNVDGELVAYCGRYPADEIPDGEPKYKLPDGFRKDLEIFGLNRVPKMRETVLVVESFLSVIQHARPDRPVIAMMGRSISEQQVAKLVDWGIHRAAILFDGDEPGREGAREVAGAIAAAGIWTKVGKTPDGKKPYQMSYKEMMACFNR